ncbi:MAG: DUF3501 family protein [Polyangiaceae bacterium]
MQPIQRNEILGLGDYEGIRERFRARVIAEKRARRVTLGEHLSGTFENRDTVLLQIQEMLRTERITSESGVAHEIETYNGLLPAASQLSLTLFVEIPERALRDEMLVRLAGLERHVAIRVGDEVFRAQGARDDAREDRTTAVHYFKFDLSDAATRAIRERTAAVSVLVDHPAHPVEAALPPATVRALADDLAG